MTCNSPLELGVRDLAAPPSTHPEDFNCLRDDSKRHRDMPGLRPHRPTRIPISSRQLELSQCQFCVLPHPFGKVRRCTRNHLQCAKLRIVIGASISIPKSGRSVQHLLVFGSLATSWEASSHKQCLLSSRLPHVRKTTQTSVCSGYASGAHAGSLLTRSARHELYSKLLVSPLISPAIGPLYNPPYNPYREIRLKLR